MSQRKDMELQEEKIQFKNENKKIELSLFTKIIMFLLSDKNKALLLEKIQQYKVVEGEYSILENNKSNEIEKLTKDAERVKAEEEKQKNKEIESKINIFLDSDMLMWVVEAQINGYKLTTKQNLKFNQSLEEKLYKNDTHLLDKMIESNINVNTEILVRWLANSPDIVFAKNYVKVKLPDFLKDKTIQKTLYNNIIWTLERSEEHLIEFNRTKHHDVNSNIKARLEKLVDVYTKEFMKITNFYKKDLNDILNLDTYIYLYKTMKAIDTQIEECSYMNGKKVNEPKNIENYKHLLLQVKNKIDNDFKEEKESFLNDVKNMNIQTVVEERTKNLHIQSAKKEVLPQLSKESLDILNNIDKLVNTCLKDSDVLAEEKKMLIINLYEKRVPEIINKYISIDPEYREKLTNVDKKKPEQLMNESLNDIKEILTTSVEEINQLRVDSLSATQRYTNTIKKAI